MRGASRNTGSVSRSACRSYLARKTKQKSGCKTNNRVSCSQCHNVWCVMETKTKKNKKMDVLQYLRADWVTAFVKLLHRVPIVECKTLQDEIHQSVPHTLGAFLFQVPLRCAEFHDSVGNGRCQTWRTRGREARGDRRFRTRKGNTSWSLRRESLCKPTVQSLSCQKR